jgi:hypothetical protein
MSFWASWSPTGEFHLFGLNFAFKIQSTEPPKMGPSQSEDLVEVGFDSGWDATDSAPREAEMVAFTSLHCLTNKLRNLGKFAYPLALVGTSIINEA